MLRGVGDGDDDGRGGGVVGWERGEVVGTGMRVVGDVDDNAGDGGVVGELRGKGVGRGVCRGG